MVCLIKLSQFSSRITILNSRSRPPDPLVLSICLVWFDLTFMCFFLILTFSVNIIEISKSSIFPRIYNHMYTNYPCSEEIESNGKNEVGVIIVNLIELFVNQLDIYLLYERLTGRVFHVWKHDLRDRSRCDTCDWNSG